MKYSTIIDTVLLLILVICEKLQDNFAECHSLKSRLFRNFTYTRRTSSILVPATLPPKELIEPPGAINFTSARRTLLTSNSTLFTTTVSPIANNVSHGLTKIGSTGSKSFYTDPDKLGLAWAEALDFCHELGLQPASLENLSEHKLVRNYLAKLPHRFFWLAGTDYFHEGHWKWLRSGENFKFQKWTQGHPSKSRRNNCLYLSYGNNGWIDASCSSNKLVIRPLCQSV